MRRAGLVLGLLVAAIACLQLGAGLRGETDGITVAGCIACHDAMLIQVPSKR